MSEETMDELAAAVVALDLRETRPMDLLAAGKVKESDRLRGAADDVAGHLMMAEGYLIKGEVAKAHEWLVKARYRLAEVVGR